jgi:hypothetical protein
LTTLTIHSIELQAPNQIQQAYQNDDTIILDKAYDTELKKKKGNLSQQVFKIRDLVRIYQPSDKTRQVWSNKIYTIEKYSNHRKVTVHMNIN